jgi:hypothetical protein
MMNRAKESQVIKKTNSALSNRISTMLESQKQTFFLIYFQPAQSMLPNFDKAEKCEVATVP